jgi:signal transduction histidine kinase
MTSQPETTFASPGVKTFVTGFALAAVALTAAALVAFPSTIRGILSAKFLPHSYCYLYDRQLMALHVTTDMLIWLSYVAISCTLVYLVWRTRREIPFSWMFLAFGLFIVACGFTHLMEVIVLWKPLYWLSGDVKLITALASVVTAIALPGLIPRVHQMVTAAGLSEQRREQVEKSNLELQQLSARVMQTQDEERRRIARELHDGIGQYLAAIKMCCDVAEETAKAEGQKKLLGDAQEMLDRCIVEVRTMSHLLHPPLLEEMGLDSAVPWYTQGFTQRSGIHIDLHKENFAERLPAAVEVAIFRVLQESLTNIHRHSGSKRAWVDLLVKNGDVLLRVRDEGNGFSSGNSALRTGVGIASMRERIRELGGELRVTSSSQGTLVEATLPIHSANEATNRS